MPTVQEEERPRVLIIDNYDSYTFNLYQFFTAYQGLCPIVIRNNQYSWEEFKSSILPYIDAIVISPGPGRPEHPEDFGICTQVLLECEKPIFGVCLGLQGLVAVNGGSIIGSKPPMHGRRSPVFHNGADLFKGIPSPMNAVRYHSLIASPDDLPKNLEINAWCDGIIDSDPTIMGLKHKQKPIWAVQFHPESISTEYGQTIVNNFCELARNCMTDTVSVDKDTLAHLEALSVIPQPLVSPWLEKQKQFHAVVEVLSTTLNPEVLFESAFSESKYSFWLDSAKVEKGLSRYSYMGGDFGPEGYSLSYSLKDKTIRKTVGGSYEDVKLNDTELFFEHLSRVMHDATAEPTDIEWYEDGKLTEPRELPFLGGLVGYVGYEMKSETLMLSKKQEDFITKHADDIPDSAFLFADRLIAFDHEENKVFVITLVNLMDQVSGSAKVQKKWSNNMIDLIRNLSSNHKVSETTDDTPVKKIPQLKLSHDKKEYIDMIQQSLHKIEEGETYEVCLTTQLKAKLNKPHPKPFEMYKHLRKRNPAPYAAYLSLADELVITSSSPERYLKVDEEGFISMKPIKGTLKAANRSNFPGTESEIAAENERRRQELSYSEKDQSENLMIVDLIRNDLNQISVPNTVQVPSLMAVESYATVHQLVSTVTATLKPDLTAVDALMRSFPPGSMTGAPKLRTVQIIESLERIPRGVYSGVLGFFSITGSADFSVVIRTAIFDQKEPNFTKVSVGAGGAIVTLSDPKAEFEEMVLKAQSVLPSIGRTFENHFHQ